MAVSERMVRKAKKSESVLLECACVCQLTNNHDIDADIQDSDGATKVFRGMWADKGISSDAS